MWQSVIVEICSKSKHFWIHYITLSLKNFISLTSSDNAPFAVGWETQVAWSTTIATAYGASFEQKSLQRREAQNHFCFAYSNKTHRTDRLQFYKICCVFLERFKAPAIMRLCRMRTKNLRCTRLPETQRRKLKDENSFVVAAGVVALLVLFWNCLREVRRRNATQ